MADNYLEKKMDDYRTQRPATRRVTHSGDAPGTLRLKVKPTNILVAEAVSESDRRLILLLTGAGYRVAFTSIDPAEGKRLAQACGALYIPGTAESASRLVQQRWGEHTVIRHQPEAPRKPLAYALWVLAQLIEHDESYEG